MATNEKMRFLFVNDVIKILGVSTSKAYQVMREINKELASAGYVTIAGRVPYKRFCEKFYCGEEEGGSREKKKAASR